MPDNNVPAVTSPLPEMEALHWDAEPQWYRPDYDRALTGVYPTLLELLGRDVNGFPSLRHLLPPGSPRRVKRVLLLCLDGFGFRELALSQRFQALYPDYGTWLTSVFPSITSCALTSLYQGLPPARHGITGHVIWKDAPGNVVDMLRGKVPGAETTLQAAGFDARIWQREPGILDRPESEGLPGYQLLQQHIIGSGLSTLIYGRSPRVGYVEAVEGFTKAAQMLEAIDEGWVSLYSPLVDTLSHVLTSDAPQVGLVARHLEQGLAWLAARLPAAVRRETAFLVIADHGQSTVRERIPIWGEPWAFLEAHTRAIGSSGRVLHVYLRGEREHEAHVQAWLREFIGRRGRVFTFDEVKHLMGPPALFGGNGGPPGAHRADEAWLRRSMGDLVVVLDDGYNWEKRRPADPPEPYASTLASQHGAMSWHEMFVPFLCAPLEAALEG